MQSNIRSFVKRSLFALALSGALWPGLALADLKVGDTVEQPTLRDANDKPAIIPDLGKKVLLILYTDPGVADINDKFADRVKALGLPEAHFRSVGVANMADAKGLANWLIRIVVRSKVGGARAYEILPAGGGRDLSQDKRAIGQRVWSVLNF